MEEVCLILGGPQGSGLETSMSVLSWALARKGLWALADREYYSNIVGRHSYVHICVSASRPPRSLKYPVEVVASMDAETVFTHFEDLSEGGALIYDTGQAGKRLDEIPSMEDPTRERVGKRLEELGLEPVLSSVLRYLGSRGVRLVGLDFAGLLKELASRFALDARQLSRYLSGLLVASTAAVLGLDRRHIRYGFERQFRERERLVEQNVFLADLVYERLKSFEGIFGLGEPPERRRKLMVVTGNDIVAVAKLVAGVRYQSYYPITPAADESFLLERYEYIELDGRLVGPTVVLQTEDEIAAITSAIGAALAGARSSTSTSGPGFDLMVEGLSYAGMNEVPVVITYYQRGGPSTGQPTRGSQSDLMSAIFSAHGEFARVVISSGDHLEAFYDTIEAFNIAERFQVPVIHLLDKFLANMLAIVPLPDLSGVRIDRGALSRGGPGYKRFDLSGLVSPRAFIGQEGTVMWYTGDEHDEYGHIVEDPENRARMYAKRVEKLKLIEESLPPEWKIGVYGEPDPDYVVVGWGSVKGVVLDAMEALRKRGWRGRYLHLRLLWPLPSRELSELLRGVEGDRVVAVEHSYGVNIKLLVSMATGLTIRKEVAKFTGRPLTRLEVVEALERILEGRESRVVTGYGA